MEDVSTSLTLAPRGKGRPSPLVSPLAQGVLVGPLPKGTGRRGPGACRP